jgi:hypothetical protein
MIDQSQHAGLVRGLGHELCLGGVHCHRLFAEHSLASFKSRERDFQVGGWRSNDAYQIDVIAFNQLKPITSDMFDAKLIGDTLRALTMPARDRNNACALTIEKPRNLRGASKAGANNPDADNFVVT